MQTFGTLSETEADELTNLLVFGLEADEAIDGVAYVAGEPLRINDAAKFMGLRTKRAHRAFRTPNVLAMHRAKLEQLRDGERARNILKAVAIRDNPGEGLAADRTVQLKAIATIEGQTKSGVNVSVSVNNQTNIAQVQPGYVIKLRPTQSPVEGLSQGLLVQGAMPVDRGLDSVDAMTVEHEA